MSLTIFLILFVALDICVADSIAPEDRVEYVIAISADGLVPAKVKSNLDELPNFRRLRREGAYTDNARNQFMSSQTSPNHASILTGSSIEEHKYARDGDNGGKVEATSIYDLVKGAGGKTCMFAQKEKFQLYARSWPIDIFQWSKESSQINAAFFNEMESPNPCNYVLLHWREPDFIGHRHKGADTKYYAQAVRKVDAMLGQVFQMIDNSPRYRDNTAIVMTSDHGFGGSNHADRSDLGNYRIPFYVWGPGVSASVDLYELNKLTRLDPGTGRPISDHLGLQPIRNQDSAIVSADYLGVYSDTGRFQNHKLDLAVGSSSPSSLEQGSASNQGKLLVPAPTSNHESPAPAPTSIQISASPNSTKTFTLVRPTPPLVPPPTRMPTPIPTPTPPTKATTSAFTEGYILFIQTFSQGNGFLGLERVLDPTAPDLGARNARYVGEMQLRPTEAVPRSVRAEHNAEAYGGISMKSASVLRLRAYVHAPDISDGMDDIDFRMILSFSTGVTLRGEKMKLSQTKAYDEVIDVSNQPDGTTIEQIRLKATNNALGRPALTIFIAEVQVQKVLE